MRRLNLTVLWKEKFLSWTRDLPPKADLTDEKQVVPMPLLPLPLDIPPPLFSQFFLPPSPPGLLLSLNP